MVGVLALGTRETRVFTVKRLLGPVLFDGPQNGSAGGGVAIQGAIGNALGRHFLAGHQQVGACEQLDLTVTYIFVVHMATPATRYRTNVAGHHRLVAFQAAGHHLQVGVPVAIWMIGFHRVFQNNGSWLQTAEQPPYQSENIPIGATSVAHFPENQL